MAGAGTAPLLPPSPAVPLGVHTLRNVQAHILDQLTDHRSSLEQRVSEAAHNSEETAVRRAEKLFGPPLEEVARRVASELPELRAAADRGVAACRADAQELRAEQRAGAAELRREVARLREELHALTTNVQRHDTQLVAAEAAKHELWRATEVVQASVTDVTKKLEASVQARIKEMAAEYEERWGRFAHLQANFKAAEAAILEVDQRTRRETSAAMDTTRMLQSHFEGCLESLRLDAFAEAKRRATEAANGVRREILQEQLLEKFTQRLHEFKTALEAHVAEHRAELLDRLDERAKETLASAERFSTSGVTQLSAHLAEVVDAMHLKLDGYARGLTDATETWRTQLKDLHKNLNAADGLARESLESFRERLDGFTDSVIEIRRDVAEAGRVAKDGLAALRGELKEETVRWHNFEDVGLPGLVSLVEQKTSEAETRSVRAALDYTERLRKLPAVCWTGGAGFAATPATTAGSAAGFTGTLTSLGSTYEAKHPLPSPLLAASGGAGDFSPLPPLTPPSAASGRRPAPRGAAVATAAAATARPG